MKNFLMEETPAKVMGLLGASLFSLAFMFSVSVSEASFTQVYNPLPNPFAAEHVVLAVDHVLAGYSDFVAMNLTEPIARDFSPAVESVAWVWDNSKQDIAYITGLDRIGSAYQQATGSVAGAYTSIVDQPNAGSITIDTVYNLILQ